MGQIGQTVGGLVGIGQNPGLNTFGAGEYGQDYGALIAQQQGNLNAVNSAQTDLATQLRNISNGQGPNLAALQLQQATNQNIQQGAGQIASQRGMNPALAQRIVAQQTAAANQNAAGQSGVLRAQQQLGAMGQLGGVLAQQGNEANQGMGAYEAAINSANQVNAGAAESRAKYGQGFGGGLLTGIGSMLAHGGEVQHFDAGGDVFNFGGNYSTPMPASSSGGGNSFISSFLGGASGGSGQAGYGKKNTGLIKSVLGNLGKANQDNAASGAQSLGSNSTYNSNMTPFGNELANSPGAAAGNAGYAGADLGSAEAAGAEAGSAAGIDAAAEEGGASGIAALLAAHGGKVPAMVSPGERYIPPQHVVAVRNGSVPASHVASKIPGKAKVKGDSETNDVVSVSLAPGGVVIPRTKADNDEEAREFLMALKKDKEKKNGPSGYAKILIAKRKNA